MKTNNNLAITTLSSVYKKYLKKKRYNDENLCDRCGYHKGCNLNKDYRHPYKSWKSNRKNQWKN